ncbi:PREDICTED: ubiquitin carboxyl-terminal hydrolase 47-like [Amphimedon queenslandica]|uniref:Ubiquitin-like domain-containing protein n=1 Tax=Amphimedon queenslandica TaxID=400682 RepID=A0AAN0JG31_AMPQE|nr:PREDICTED: ubiquitin carboxyl-terminal hydrolase 47-like [Amphimedon queenslandica]|eukprot:XP_019855761.1 PREDICTED: ubiquitin carboxyl-terminal hydrolase 47-like [Amphimedon queenslandica]
MLTQEAVSKYFPTPEVGVVPETIKDHDVVPPDNTSTADEPKAPANAQSDITSSPSDGAVASNSSSQPLSPQVEIPVPIHLLGDFKSMKTSYTRMFYNVCKILKRKLNVDDIKEFLSYYSVTFRRKVEQCSDISSILHYVKDECSLTDVTLLHSVVEEMEIIEAKEHIETYRAELKEFYKSISVSLCLEKRFGSIPHLKYETVTFIFDWKPEEHLLQDIKGVLSKNLTLWRRQDVRQKELKEKDQDLLQHTEVISYIILQETEYKLRDAISSKEKEAIELKKELSKMKVLTELEAESLFIQSDTDSVKEVEEEPLYEELTVLRSQFNEIKDLPNKLSKMKIEYLKSLTSNTDSAASRVIRGMTFEIDDCKFHLQAMTRPDYQPSVDNKRIIEKLQERITLMNMELVTEREHNEKIIKDIKDHLEEIEEKRQREMKQYKLYCNHPVTGELIESTLEVHKDELLPSVLDKAYELMKLAPHIPIERCRLVEYDDYSHAMNRSFDLDEFQHQTIGQLMDVAEYYYDLFLETRKENETFKKYNDGGINLEISVVDLAAGKVHVGPTKPMRGESGWTVRVLKQHIGEVFNISPSCMRIAWNENWSDFCELKDEESLLLYKSRESKLLYVSSDPEDYQKEFKDSLMYRYVEFHVNSMILLNITIPPGPEAMPTITERRMMKIISMIEENKGKERRIQVRVNKSITLIQLKEELVPLIGVPPTGFRMYEIIGNREYELEALNQTLKDIGSGSELIVRLGRALGILMRLRDKSEVYPGTVYLDDKRIDTSSKEMYVEPLKGPEKKKHDRQRQLSELSGVPAGYISYTEGISFPVEISCLDIENKLKWYSITSGRYSLLGLHDDGRVIYYKLKKIRECELQH